MIDRRAFQRILTVLVALSLALPLPLAHAQLRRVLIGYSSFSSNQTPLWVAKEEGIYKHFGLDIDLILIEGGTRGAQALISGSAAKGEGRAAPHHSARARGRPLV